MEKLEFILLGRKDLGERAKNKAANKIEWNDFEETDQKGLCCSFFKTFAMANLVMFIDVDGETIILKNRYGFVGVCK